MSSIGAVLTAICTVFLNYQGIALFRANDKELEESIKDKQLDYMYVGSLLIGLLCGTMPKPLNFIMIIPTVVVFISAETDMFMKQIYTFPCMVSLITGISFIIVFHFNIISYLTHMIFCVVLLFILRITRAINTGDVELMFSVTPYLYLVSALYKRPTFIESFLFYVAGSCVFTIFIYFKKYRREKNKTFPFALPACLFYSSYFGILSIANLAN